MNHGQSTQIRAIRHISHWFAVLVMLVMLNPAFAADPARGQVLFGTTYAPAGDKCTGCHTVANKTTGLAIKTDDAFKIYKKTSQYIYGVTATTGANIAQLNAVLADCALDSGMCKFNSMPQVDKDDMAAYMDAVYWGKPIAAATSSCAASTLSWMAGANTCNASVATAASGTIASLVDSLAPTTGTSAFQCASGTWTQLASPAATCNVAVTPPATCAASALSWTVGGNTCDAVAATAASGQSTTLSDLAAPTTGAATFACTNGAWGAATGATCNAPAPCAAGALSWTVGGNICDAAVASIASGASTVLNDTLSPTTGAATFSCTNGAWGVATGATCNAPAPCVAGPLSWSVGGSVCNASALSTASGAATVLTDSLAPATGVATFSCSNGAWGAPTSATCTTPAPCAASALSWTVGGNTCDTVAATAASGQSTTLSDLAAPTTGAATFACTNGAWGAATGATCNAPAPCAAGALSWTVGGNICDAVVASTASGASTVLNDTLSPTTGAATFSCTNGAWGVATSATCATAVAAGPCAASALSWSVGTSVCNATATLTTSGASATLSDITAPATGVATFSCSNGAWGAPTSATCTTPAPCAARALSWTVGGNTCDAVAATAASGQSTTLSDLAAPTTGAATFACTNGAWGAATGATCNAPAPCAAGALSWTVGGNICDAAVASIASGASTVLNDTLSPTTGAATFSCTNGAWGAATGATCNAPAPCAAGPLSWSVGGSVCNASALSTASGAAAVLTDSLAPATGVATFSCSNGTWGAPTSATCVTPPADCVASPLSWTAGGNTCNATAGVTVSGAAAALSDVSAPTTGAATFACSNGTWGGAAPGATCVVPAPVNCAASTLGWSVGANSCGASAPASASGASLSLSNATGSNTGAASFTCNNGTWSAPTLSSCDAPPPPSGCVAGPLSWTVGANTCNAAALATASGASTALADSIAPTTGTASFSCTNGVWSAPVSATCTAASGVRGISSINGKVLWKEWLGAVSGSACADCHGALKPDVFSTTDKIGNSAGTAANQGDPASIRRGIINARTMNEFSAVSDADLADLAAYVNAVRYTKPLTDAAGVPEALPFPLWSNGVAVPATTVVLPVAAIGSASTTRTTLVFGTPVGLSLNVTTLTLHIAGGGAANFSLLPGSTVKQGSVTTNACPALPFTLAASQTCTVDVVMAVNSPGEFEATLAVTTNDQDAVITINGKVTAQATGGAGGGGCTMRSGPGLLDPMLILLSLFSLGVLIVRRKKTPSPFL